MRRLVPIGACILVAAISNCASHNPDVMTWTEYQRRPVTWPYLVELHTSNGALFYFGAKHTFDPADPQVEQIEEAWRTFRPDIAFTEGGSPPIQSSRDEAVRKAGEPGLVRFLAARDDVPTTTLDPSRPEEVAHLAKRFPREQIKLSAILRAVMQFVQRNGAVAADDEATRVLTIYASTPGLHGEPRTVAEVQAAYARFFPGRGRYENVPSEWFDPVRRDTFLNEISRASSEYRDEFMVNLLEQHVREGQRVFAVVGGSHVVMQEPALRWRLRKKPPR